MNTQHLEPGVLEDAEDSAACEAAGMVAGADSIDDLAWLPPGDAAASREWQVRSSSVPGYVLLPMYVVGSPATLWCK